MKRCWCIAAQSLRLYCVVCVVGDGNIFIRRMILASDRVRKCQSFILEVSWCNGRKWMRVRTFWFISCGDFDGFGDHCPDYSYNASRDYDGQQQIMQQNRVEMIAFQSVGMTAITRDELSFFL